MLGNMYLNPMKTIMPERNLDILDMYVPSHGILPVRYKMILFPSYNVVTITLHVSVTGFEPGQPHSKTC